MSFQELELDLAHTLCEIEAGRSDVTAVVRITSASWEEAKSMIQCAGWNRSTRNLTNNALP